MTTRRGPSSWQVSWTTQQPSPLRDRRAKRIKLTIVSCLDCGAPVGQPCVTATGKPLNSGHIVRRRLAMRKMREETPPDSLPGDSGSGMVSS